MFKLLFQSNFPFKAENINLVMIWVIKRTAGVIAIILPDTLANVLALTLWELLRTAEISADNNNTLFSGTRNIHSFKSQRNPDYSIV